MSRRDKNLGKKWVNFNVVVDMDGKLAMDTTEYSRERRLYADYLTYSRLLAQFRSRDILFLNTQETISHLQAECTTKESLYSSNRKGKKSNIQFWAYFAQICSTKRAKATKKKNNE